MTKQELTNYINANIVENTGGTITATNLKTIFTENTANALTVNEVLSLTNVEKMNVLSSLGMGNETVRVNLTCDTPSAIQGVIITVTYGGESTNYT